MPISKLSAIQNTIEVPKSQYNKFGNFYYRNVEDIQSAVKPHLEALGLTLTVSDELVMIGERYYVKATARLSDGENEITTTAYARESESKKGMDDSMCTGTSSSYARKYALGGMFLLDDQKDADHADNTGTMAQIEAKDAKDDDKEWYNDFEKHKDAMIDKIGGGEAPEQILSSLRQKYKVNKKIADAILAL